MSTRCMIGKLLPDNTVRAIYCHFDGYPKYALEILRKSYTDEKKVDALLDLGDLSVLGSELGEKHDFDDRGSQGDVCTAYHRDRGEDIEKTGAKNMLLIKFRKYPVDYCYLFENCFWEMT